MIPTLPGIVAVAALALVLARRRPALRPVAVALAALAAIDCARVLPLPRRADVLLWVGWAAVPAALAWKVWALQPGGGDAIAGVTGGERAQVPVGRPCVTETVVGRVFGAAVVILAVRFLREARRGLTARFTGRVPHAPILARLRAVPAWARVAASFALYAGAIAFAPIPWRSHPWAWTVARTLPYVLAPCLGMVAWAMRTKDEGPASAINPSEPPSAQRAPTGHHGPHTGPGRARTDASTPAQPNASDPAAQASRRIAALLLASALVDTLVLLPSLNAATWPLAFPLAWATWIAVGVALLMAR